jgi:hypothetical protein
MRTANIRVASVTLADAAAAKHMRKSIPSLISSCGVVVVDVGPLDAHQLNGRYRTRRLLVSTYSVIGHLMNELGLFLDQPLQLLRLKELAHVLLQVKCDDCACK